MQQVQTSYSQAELGPTPLRVAGPAVLVVDDVEANLKSMRAVLEGMRCDVVVASSGNDALRELLHREFALVLLDVQMPEMDGYEVARYVKENPYTREVPIVFLTAMNENIDSVLRGYDSGAVDFLFKPINPHILRGKVRVFLELSRNKMQIEENRIALAQSNAEIAQVAKAKAQLVEQFRQANADLEAAYNNLATTQSQLVQAAKMASLGELVAGIAHEINNPLAFVQSHLSTVKRSLGELDARVRPTLDEGGLKHWERAQNRVSEMNVGIDRITELVVKLRTFSRLDEGAVKSVSVKECVQSVLTISKHRFGERIQVHTEFGEPDVIECYAGLLNQAIMNLVSNAIDAIEGEGRLTITTGAGEDGDYRISVADTGSGIPEALRQRVCEPFFTTKPPGQGTGLGLSITYSIVQKHGGRLEIDSNGERGTRMTIRIPATLGKKKEE
jgi:two-component system, NtrC family, sensor kinase